MGKTIIKGTRQDGTIDAEYITTPELVTRLIRDLDKRDTRNPKDLCDAEIRHRLEEIRLASEQDERIRFAYANVLKKHKREEEEAEKKWAEFEKELVQGGIEAAKKCAEVHHDVDSMLAILKMCKAIAGDKFRIELGK